MRNRVVVGAFDRVEKPPKEQAGEAAAAAGGSSPSPAAPERAYAPAPAAGRPAPAAKSRSPLLVPGVLATVLVAGAGGWFATRSGAPAPAPITQPREQPSTPAENPANAPQGGAARIAEPPKKDAPPRTVTPAPAAAMSDTELLAQARNLAALLGQGNGREVRKHFTDSLKDSGSLTVWGGRVNKMGALQEVSEPRLLKNFDPERRQVRVVLAFEKERFAAIFTFTPDGRVSDLDIKPQRQKAAD